MSDFEFFLAFYGLLLGLSLTEVTTKFADAIGARHRVPIGTLSPALAVFVLLDISSFWIVAWGCRDVIRVSWETVLCGLLIAVTLNFSAAMVFPREAGEWASLDDYYWREKRFVLTGIAIANLLSFTACVALLHMSLIALLPGQILYWIPFAILFLSRRRWLNLVMIGLLVTHYVAFALLLGSRPIVPASSPSPSTSASAPPR